MEKLKIQNGIDIIEVDRIKNSIERQGKPFLNKVFTDREIEYCSNSGLMTYQHYAGRFAAKEAIYKAISDVTSQKQDLWNKIEIYNDETGKPMVNLEKLNIENIISMDLSISHIKDYAIASFSVIFDT